MNGCDDSYLLLAAEHLQAQAQAISQHMRGARRARDIEAVHQARVATRRFRAGMRVFADCFPPRDARRWRKAVRRVTRRLGPARDADVQIEAVRQFLARMRDTTQRPGIQRLLLRLRQDRRRRQTDVVAAIDRMEASGVLKEIVAATEFILASLRSRNVVLQSPYVFLRAEREILRRAEDLLAQQDCLSDEQAKSRHHEMRISAKRLRYTMEICQPVYAGALDAPVETVKQLQTLLGDMHDCDVWDDRLSAFEKTERQRTREFYGTIRPYARLRGGVERFRDLCRRQRKDKFAQLVALWEQLRQQGFWDSLASELVSRLQQPTEMPQDARDARDAKLTEEAKP